MGSVVSSLLNEEMWRINLMEENDKEERERGNSTEEVNLARKGNRPNT